MIPLVDDFLQSLIAEKLRWLKAHPYFVDVIFQTGRRKTLENLREFIVKRPIQVIIVYPKEQTSLPAYVITLAPEQEQPMGLGDEYSTFDDYQFDAEELGGNPEELDPDSEEYQRVTSLQREIARNISGTWMNSTYRVECWSDNGDITSYMYVILKWCLMSSRMQMLRMGWINPTFSGTDLEPVPDYFPLFVYRRALQLNVMYTNLYFDTLEGIDDILPGFDDPNYPLPELINMLKATYILSGEDDTLVHEWLIPSGEKIRDSSKEPHDKL